MSWIDGMAGPPRWTMLAQVCKVCCRERLVRLIDDRFVQSSAFDQIRLILYDLR